MEIYNFNLGDNAYEVKVMAIEGREAELDVNGIRYKVDIDEMGFDPSFAQQLRAAQPQMFYKPKDMSGLPGSQAAFQPAPQAAAPVPSAATAAPAASAGGDSDINAPMPGQVYKITVSEGDEVKAGDVIMILEAMKMENPIKATTAGVVSKLHVSEGDALSEGTKLATISSEATEISSAPQAAAAPPPQAPAAAAPAPAAAKPAAGANDVVAPMPGQIFKVKVAQGDAVKVGDTVLVMEAMKMENNIKATSDGTVSGVHVAEGDAVAEGDILVSIS